MELHEPLDLNGSRDPKKAPKFSHVFYNPYRGVPDNQNAGRTLLGHRWNMERGRKRGIHTRERLWRGRDRFGRLMFQGGY